VLQDVPPNCTVVGIPGRVKVRRDPTTGIDLEHNKLSDPMADIINDLNARISKLEEEIEKLKGNNK